MTKILLVEKTYRNTEENLSITAKWVEVPDGEEGLFLIRQLETINEVEQFSEKECKLKPQAKSANTKISDTLIKLSTPIGLLVVVIVAVFKICSQNH